MGASLSSKPGSGPIAAINVTPFVDVVLVLLVIFMITAPILLKDQINIQLPQASSSDASTGKTLGFAIAKDGVVLVDGVPASRETIISQVEAALVEDPKTQAVLSADKEARHGDVVQVIDWIKQAGLQRFAIQIEREES